MASYSDYVRDDSGYQRPVEDAQLFLYKKDGTLASANDNPVYTDVNGFFRFDGVPDGVYTLDTRYGGVTLQKGSVIVGVPPQFVGPPGDGNGAVSIGLLAEAPNKLIPEGTDLVIVSGNTAIGDASAGMRLAYDATVDEEFVAASPDTSFVDMEGRGFRKAPDPVKLAAPSTITRTVDAKLGEIVSLDDFGAIGDGTLHPLSERFTTLAAAQDFYKPYPGKPHHITSLSMPIDYAALQAGLWAVENGGCLEVPEGRYRIGDNTLLFANYCAIRGTVRAGDSFLGFGAVIEGATTGATKPMFFPNNLANCTFFTASDITFRGGTHILYTPDNTASVTAIIWDRVVTEAASVSIMELNRMEVSTFRDCFLFSGNRTGWGIHIRGFPNNNNTFSRNRFDGAGAGVYWSQGGCENIVFDGGSFEGGGQAGAYTLRFDGNVVASRGVAINGVYIEQTGEYLIYARNFTSIYMGGNCEITGTSAGNPGGGLTAYKFDVGAGLFTFGDNGWGEYKHGALTIPPLNTLLLGVNDGLQTRACNTYVQKTRDGFKCRARVRDFTNQTAFLLSNFLRESAANVATNDLSLEGTMRIEVQGPKNGEPSTRVKAAIIQHLLIDAPPGGGFQKREKNLSLVETPNSGVTLATSLSSLSTSADFVLAVGGLDPAGPSSLAVEWDVKVLATNPLAILPVVLP